jgi:hypothetical protein
VAVAAGAPPALGPAQAHCDEQLTVHREEILNLRVVLERQRADAMAEKVVQTQLEDRLNVVEWYLGDTRDQLKQLTADYKALLGCLDRFGVAIPCKRSRTDGADEGCLRILRGSSSVYALSIRRNTRNGRMYPHW